MFVLLDPGAHEAISSSMDLVWRFILVFTTNK